MKFKGLAERLEIDEPTLVSLLHQFVKTSLSDVEELARAVEDSDAEKAVQAAHSIKGAALNLEFAQIASAAARAEEHALRNDMNGVEKAACAIKKQLDQISANLPG